MEVKDLTMLEDALKELKLFETDEHHPSRSYTHGKAVLDINALVGEFEKFCPDILVEVEHDKKSYATKFTSIILMTIGPEYSKMKKNGDVDKVWRFKFEDEAEIESREKDEKEKTNQGIVKMLYVCSNKKMFDKLDVDSTGIKMTLEHASLVAMFHLQKLIKYAGMKPEPVYVMTPLCTVIFSKHHIKDIAEELKMNPCDVTMTMNASCVRNSHVLPTSDVNCALACNIFTTRGLPEKIRKSILKKIAQQYYCANGTRYSVPELKVWMKYTTGGLPVGFVVEDIIKLADSIRMRRE